MACPSVCRLAATRPALTAPKLGQVQCQIFSATCNQNWSGNSVDLANEINDLINKLQIEKPNISYTELTNVIVAAYCPVVANMASLTASEKWRRMRQFDLVLQQQIAANTLAPGTLIIANVPLPPAVYRELQSRAAPRKTSIKLGPYPAKTADLPIEQPSTFSLSINLKTAKAMNHTIPAALVLRADRLVE